MALKHNEVGLWVLVWRDFEHHGLVLIVLHPEFIHCTGETIDISWTVVKTKNPNIYYIKRCLEAYSGIRWAKSCMVV